MGKRKKWLDKLGRTLKWVSETDIPSLPYQQGANPPAFTGNDTASSDPAGYLLSSQTTGVTPGPLNSNAVSSVEGTSEGWPLPYLSHPQSDSGIDLGQILLPTQSGGDGGQVGSTSTTGGTPGNVPFAFGAENPAPNESQSNNANTGDNLQPVQDEQAGPNESSIPQDHNPPQERRVRFSTSDVVITSQAIDSHLVTPQATSEPTRESQTPIPGPPDELPLNEPPPNEQNSACSETGNSRETGPHPHTDGSVNNGISSSGGDSWTTTENSISTISYSEGPSERDADNVPGVVPSGDNQQKVESGPSGGGQQDDQPSQSDGNWQQSLTRMGVVAYNGVISNQAHPLPFLKGTSRAHATLPYLCAGVTAHIQISKDSVPFVFPDLTLHRFFDARNPEDLNWSELSEIHLRSGKGPDVRIMSLKDLLDWLSLEECSHRKAYLDIKSKRPPERVAELISQQLNETPRPGMWKTRIVICISHADDLPAFGVVLAGHRIVLNCRGNLKKATRLSFIHNLLQFKFNHEVLAAGNWPGFMADSKMHGRDVYVEADSTDHMKLCIRAGVTGIVTDNPQVLDGLYWEANNKRPSWVIPPPARRKRRVLAVPPVKFNVRFNRARKRNGGSSSS